VGQEGACRGVPEGVDHAAMPGVGGRRPERMAHLNVIEGVSEDVSLCGYCERGASATLHFYAHLLSVWDYQALLDLGWRRSGCLLYRPVLERSCCPPHTIRLDVHKFRPSKVRPGLVQPAVPGDRPGSASRDPRGARARRARSG